MARTLLKVALATVTFAVLGGGLLRSQTSRTAATGRPTARPTPVRRYSPLDQINKDTVKGLRIAWRQSAMPLPVQQARPDAAAPRAYQHTPLKVGGLLYMSTSLGTVAALDPTTGEVVWFDPPPHAGRRQRVAGAGLLDRRQRRTDHRDLRPVPRRAEREDRKALRRLRRRTAPSISPRATAARRSAGYSWGGPATDRARRHRRRRHARRRGRHHQRDRARADGDASRPTSAASTSAPASCCGRSTPCRGRANSATRPG